MADTNRRNFFRQAATEAVRGAREVIPLIDPLVDLVDKPKAPAAPDATPAEQEDPRTESATPTSHPASIDEMLAIATELGLGARVGDLRRLAVSSTRLTTAPLSEASSFAGGEPTVPAAVEVPELEGGPAQFVALLDLPDSGRLWVFQAESDGDDPNPGETAPAETDTDAADAVPPEVVAVFEPAGDPDQAEAMSRPPGATPLLASEELTLPRPWSPAVERLQLAPSEQTSWQELRSRLAAAQGVPLGESASPHVAIHRLRGYPDERRGEMPLICELRLLGVDLEGKPPATHPLAAALEGEIGNWRLLAQLSADDDLDWSWGPRFQRLYVWAQVEDPESTEYASIQVVVQ